MRKIILGLAVSLDSFIEGPNGEYDWCLTDQDYGMSEFFKRIDTVFMGRKSYELTQSMGEEAITGFPKLNSYVFSTTLKEVKDDIVIVNGDLKTEVIKIKRQPGKDIWLFGGASLLSSFLNESLIDEYWLSVHPIILGGGKPLFTDVKAKINLKLTESKTYSSGLVSLKYVPA
jgi:dihydrofolate reductase